MRRLLLPVMLAIMVTAFAPSTTYAQQSFNFYIGAFAPFDEADRDFNDVIRANEDFLDFDMRRFTSATVGVEWLVGLNDNVEAGLGLGFYQHTEPAFDCCAVFDTTGDPIVADLRLRIVPFTATLRFLPMGHHGPIEPYIGAGLGVYGWRYSETGDFVATDGDTIVHGAFRGSGSATGPVILAGIRVPAGAAAIGFEARYQSAKGELPDDQGFAGTKIDLGGFNYLLTFNVRF